MKKPAVMKSGLFVGGRHCLPFFFFFRFGGRCSRSLRAEYRISWIWCGWMYTGKIGCFPLIRSTSEWPMRCV